MRRVRRSRSLSPSRALTGFDLGLAAAHDALNRLMAGEAVPVTLYLTQGGEMPFSLCRFGLSLGQPIETRPGTTLDELLTDEERDSFEGWRRAQPAQPSVDEALGLMVRAYLTEHGLLRRSEKRHEAALHGTE